MYFSLVSPLDPNPDRKYQPYLHMKSHHDRLFVTDLEAAQDSLEFFQTANGSVFCYDTVPLEFLTKIINFKRTDQKGLETKNFKRRNCLPRKRVNATTDSRGKPPGITQKI